MEEHNGPARPPLSTIEWVAEELSSMLYFYKFALQAPIAKHNDGLLATIDQTVSEYLEKTHNNPESFARPAWEYVDFMVKEARQCLQDARSRGHPYMETVIDVNEHATALADIMRAIDADLLQASNPQYSRREAEAFVALQPRFQLQHYKM